MNNWLYILQVNLNLKDFKHPALCYLTAFVLTLVAIPFVISFVKRYKLYDKPNARKVHVDATPTLGGLAIFAGFIASLLIWFNFTDNINIITFFLSLAVLLVIGIMDDLKDISARYKLVIELALAILISISGIRIQDFGGLFGLHKLSIPAQHIITVIAITGITNAFNLIDGIDGLAGGLGFMCFITLGIFLTASKQENFALISFAFAGALLAFLYYNLNPAKIFMGDTGSLVLGFAIAVLCIQLIKINSIATEPVVPNISLFTLGIILIPVFDTLRVFAIRIWSGRSPFSADKNHIHHLITKTGFSHGFAARLICVINGLLLLLVYWLKDMRPEVLLLIMILFMAGTIYFLKNVYILKPFFKIHHTTDYEVK